MLMTEMCRPHISYSLDENCPSLVFSSWSSKIFSGLIAIEFMSPISSSVSSGSTETNKEISAGYTN